MAYSSQTEVSDGTLQTILIAISFFDKSEITVYRNGGLVPSNEWSWATDNSVQFGIPQPLGSVIQLRRTTDISEMRHIFTQGSQFNNQTLDEDYTQILHIAQEAIEGTFLTERALRVSTSEPAIPTLPAIADRANKLLSFDAAGKPIVVAPVSGSATDLAISLADSSSPIRGAGQIGYGPTMLYADGTLGAAVKAVSAAGFMKDIKSSILMDIISDVGNTTALDAAIRSGTVRVVFAGDSIIEGDRDGIYPNSCAALVMRKLREQNPDVTFEFANFSIAGLGVASFSNPNYKGMAPPADPYIGFYRAPGNAFDCTWPGGSVIGKAWWDHAKDFTPDLLIWMFGANDIGEESTVLAQHNRDILNYVNTWAKPPSCALMAAANPASSSIYVMPVQRAANVVRSFARENNLTLLDLNRVYNGNRYARDVTSQLFLADSGFAGFPAGWVKDPGTTLALDTSVPGAINGQGVAYRQAFGRDLVIAADFVATNWVTTTMGFHYGGLGTKATEYSVFANSAGVSLYWGVTQIGYSALPGGIPNGTSINLKVAQREARHEIFLNNVRIMKVWNYGNLLGGNYGVECTGGFGAIYNLVVQLGNWYSVGKERFTDADMYGPTLEGGNGINHPTKLAIAENWVVACTPLLNHIKRTKRVGNTADIIAPIRAQSVEAFDVAGTTLQMWMNGTSAGNPSGVLTTPTGAQCTVYDCRKVVNATTATVNTEVFVFHSPGLPTSKFLLVQVPTPPGTWLLTAHAVFTKDSAGVFRNAIVVTGTRSA